MHSLTGKSLTRHLKPFLLPQTLSSPPVQAEPAQRLTESMESSSTEIPFSRSKIGTFFQTEASVENNFDSDSLLKSYLRRVVPSQFHANITKDLHAFGARTAVEIAKLGRDCDVHLPQLKQYDAWGKRVDEIITCQAWKEQKKICATEGILAIGYERESEEFSRLHQMCKLFLYGPVSGLYTCPLGMSDGAAKLVESMSVDSEKDKKLLAKAFRHLTSRDPKQFWTSGQWMTERGGGSDVASATETVAIPQPDGSYKIYGYKWFTSATDGDMAFALARVRDPNTGKIVQGSKGLSLFYVEMRDEEGKLNNIQVEKLKDKLGTRQVATAEILLDGTKGYLVGQGGRGVAGISNMLTITRIQNAVNAAGGLRRMMQLTRDYSHKRAVFGKKLHESALHVQTLARMELETRGAFMLAMETARLLGLAECNKASDNEKLMLRMLAPLGKLYNGKEGFQVVSEGLESFGGAGYLEDTGLPAYLRDGQVIPIWEGTTNVVSLDVLRSLAKSNGAVLKASLEILNDKLQQAGRVEKLAPSCEKVQASLTEIVEFVTGHTDQLETAARDFSISLGRTFIATFMLEHAAWDEASAADVIAAQRWCEKQLFVADSNAYKDGWKKDDYELVMNGYVPSKL